MMSKYRNKDNPTYLRPLPRVLKKGTKVWTGAPGAELSPEERIFYGEYLDMSPIPGEGYQLGDIPTWDEKAGTVAMNVVAIQPRPIDEVIEDINAACQQHIYVTLGWPIEKQTSCMDGYYPPIYAEKMRVARQLTIDESNRCSTLAEQGLPYTCNWPTAADGALSYKEVKSL